MNQPQQVTKQPLRAVYGWPLDREPLAGRAPDAVAQQLREWGIDAVIGPLPDRPIIEAAQQAGIAVYLAVGMFTGKHHWERHPDSRPITAAGEPFAPDRWYHGVNPTHPGVRSERLEYIAHSLREYAIDGIWLDAIRWPCHWEVAQPRIEQTSFDSATLRRFEADMGVALGSRRNDPPEATAFILSQHLDEWTLWKCRQITELVADIRSVVRAAGKGKVLGAFTVPWQPEDFDNAITRIIGQDYVAMGEHVDIFSPMVYHRMCARPVDWIQGVTEHVHKLSGRPVWPIIQSMSEPDHLSNEEFEQALQHALRAGGSSLGSIPAGVIVFTLEAMLREGRLQIWQRTASG